MRYFTEHRDAGWTGFYFEAPGNPDNVMVLFANQGGGVTVAVSEERAMDSYNEGFELTIELPENAAKQLRDYLVEIFPPADSPKLRRE